MSHVVLPLAACTPELSDTVGGKAVGLGALLSQNLPVPDGFAVTTAAYSATITTVRDAPRSPPMPGTTTRRRRQHCAH